MGRIKVFFLLLRIKTDFWCRTLATYIQAAWNFIKFRIWLHRELRACPDEDSRERRLAEIRQAMEQRKIDAARILNLLNCLQAALLDSIEAVEAHTNPENELFTDSDREAAPDAFKKAKSRMLTNIAWLQIEEECENLFSEAIVEKLRHIELEDIKSTIEWLDLLSELQGPDFAT